MKTPKVDLTNPIFHDENVAREHLETLLWPDGPYCPRCGVTGERITKLKGKSTRPGVHKCKDCRKPFTVTVGTAMERSKIPLPKWVFAAQLMASSKKGMSALQLQRMLGTNYETAWFLFHRLREAAHDPKRGPLGGENKASARRTYRATSPSSISGTTPASCRTQSGLPSCYAGPRASGFCINSLVKPRTPKQKARAFIRWRKKRLDSR